MGLFLHLIVNLHQIEATEWEAAFDQTLELLRAFPIPAIKYDSEYGDDWARGVLTKEIFLDAGRKSHWEIIGDEISCQTAENFFLFRDKHYYRIDGVKDVKKDVDVLWAREEKAKYTNSGNGIDLFCSKTQGYPYIYPLLAVGILLENLFPRAVYMIGDINDDQVNDVMKWMEEHFSKPMQRPVCYCAKRLYQRIKESYEGDCDLALSRYGTLCHTTLREFLTAIYEEEGQGFIIRIVRGSLKGSSFEDKKNVIIQFINLMKDLQKSLLIIFAINTESNFEDLLRILIKSGITIPVQMRPEARMWQLLFRLPEQCDLYLSNNELLAIFVELIPTKEAMFEKIIQEEEASLKNTLLAMKEESPFDFGCKPTDDIKIILIKKAKLQKGKCKESSIQLLNEAIQNHIEQYPQKKRVYESLEEYRPALYKATMEHGLFLTESTWNMIEKESQQEILQSLLALSLIDNNEYHFSTSRRYLMEEPDLWKNLLKISEQATAV